MHLKFEDITDRIAEDPRWWLESVPRYCDFAPNQVDVYANEAALLLIEGQSPAGLFEVAVFSPSRRFRFGIRAHLLTYGDIFVGDPPNYKGRASPTMQTHTIKILQYWKRDDFEWVRDDSWEVQLHDDQSDISFLPNYSSMARQSAGSDWDAALEARDADKLCRYLAAVRCPDPEAVMRILTFEAVADQLNRDLRLLWSRDNKALV